MKMLCDVDPEAGGEDVAAAYRRAGGDGDLLPGAESAHSSRHSAGRASSPARSRGDAGAGAISVVIVYLFLPDSFER